MTTLIVWLLAAVNAWGSSPVPRNELEHVADVRFQVAEKNALIAYDVDEPPIYQGPYARAQTALILVSIQSLETRFSERIILGHCRPYECDGGIAVGLMQVHLGDFGMRLVGKYSAKCGRFASGCWLAADLVADESLQIRVGLHVLRTQGFGAFSRANDARDQATEWLIKHPPPMTDAQAQETDTTSPRE